MGIKAKTVEVLRHKPSFRVRVVHVEEPQVENSLEAEALMRQEGIPYLDATSKSVEELATTILQEAKLERRIY